MRLREETDPIIKNTISSIEIISTYFFVILVPNTLYFLGDFLAFLLYLRKYEYVEALITL